MMIALTPFIGALRPVTACLNARTVYKKALQPKTVQHSAPIQFAVYANGNTLAFQHNQPIAWIVQGAHHGQVDNQAFSCTYYDVAFIQRTRHTSFLDSSPEFDTEQQARDFITAHFKAEVEA